MDINSQAYRVALVDDDPDQLRLLQAQLNRRGFTTQGFSSPQALQKALMLGDCHPDALIMDLMFPGGDLQGAEVLQELAVQLEEPLPVVCISSRNDQAARLAALRGGASAYMTKPLDISFLTNRLETLLEKDGVYRVLLVDDEPSLVQLYSAILEESGLKVRALSNPHQFLETYDAFQPDVTLLDIAMPEVSGLELAKLLSEYRGIDHGGIIFLSGNSDKNSQLQALSAGGDDFIAKPPQAEELIAKVRTRAQAARKLKQLGNHMQQMNQEMEALYNDREMQHEALNRHAIVSVADARGRITYINNRFCQISGYQPEELVGQDHRILKSGKHPPEFYRGIWQTISAGLVWQGEICNRRKDGSYYWVESTITPFFDQNGKIKEYVSIRTDITRVKNIELELRQSEQEQKFMAWDRGERIKEAQCLAQVMHKITDEGLGIEALLADVVDLIPPGWKIPESTWARIHFAGQEYTSQGFRETPCVQEASKSIDSTDDQDQAIFVEVFTDASSVQDLEMQGETCRIFLPEEKALLEQLAEQLAQAIGRRMDRCALIKAKEEADRANKAKSNFLSSMSHELRTPMNAILGFAQMLEYDEELNNDQRDSAHEIIKAGKHLLTLINDVLDLAKIEAGKISVSMETVDLHELANECCPLLQPLTDKRSISLQANFLPGQAVHADRVRLKQVLLNLCSNAIKYNHEQGKVFVDAESQPEGRLRIRVQDTGPGISEEQLKTLAQPFNRLNHETSGVEGTGIGLTISKKLAEAMEGVLGVESQVGVGSTFWVELQDRTSKKTEALPDQQKPVQEASPDQKALSESGQPAFKVLSIDDNPVNLKLIEQALRNRQDLQVISAHLPGMGIELAMANTPDVILLDINMPSMDGYQVLKVLRTDSVLKTIPVVALTANALPEDLNKGREAGFSDYLTKPLDIDLLNDTLNTWLKKEAQHALE
ncbi:response regulator [Marinospirillum sp.]|uniref:response regulator n=1 Tax=Marinospirillum sp. TaxID=2183934 RepID=UPI00286FC07F|nr:response regulator [Marinospirillum sp.]MDR9467222.1 response regulator [Marinospirillum sp.]